MSGIDVVQRRSAAGWQSTTKSKLTESGKHGSMMENTRKGTQLWHEEHNLWITSRRCRKGAGWLNTLTKAKPWRGNLQDTPMQRENSEGWKEQRQVGKEVRESDPRPWEAASKDQRRETTTGAGTDAFHPRVPLGLSDETCQKVVDFLHVVEVVGRWPAANCIIQ